MWTDLKNSAAALFFVLGLLAAAGVLASRGTISPSDAYGFLSLVIGATGVAGTIVLAGPTSNTQLAPHVLILLAVIGYTTALGYLGLFQGTEVIGVFGVIVGGGSLAIGVAKGAQAQANDDHVLDPAIHAKDVPESEVHPIA